MQPTRFRLAALALALAAGGLVVPSPAAAAEQAGAPVRILPLGDSLTWGVGSSDRSGYRTRLRAALTAAGVAVDFTGSQHNGVGADLEHEGHPGWRIDELDARIGPWISSAAPDVVLLDAGTNDYVQGHDVARAPARLARLLDRIHALAPDAHIVLARLLVIAGDRRAAGVRTLNAAIPRIAAARRDFVSVADMARIPVRNTVDGVHPGDLGYRQMAYQWYQGLRRVLPGGPSWPQLADPFPLPAVGVSAVRRDGAVRVTARLAAALTPADLSGVTVRLQHRRAGATTFTSLGTARTGADGVVRFSRRMSPGTVVATVVSGRAAGRASIAIRV